MGATVGEPLCDDCPDHEACMTGTPCDVVKWFLQGGQVLASAIHTRPSWDDWGLGIAAAVARRADCSRRRIGAVVMRPDHTIVATGYNGAAPGARGCLAGGCPRASSGVEQASSYDTGPGACIAVHAEQNALLRASWDEMVGSTIFVTDEPCPGCWRMLVASPLARAVWPSGSWGRNREDSS